MENDPELQQTARLAVVFCYAALERIDKELPRLSALDVTNSMSQEESERVDWLTAQIEDSAPSQWIFLMTEETIEKAPQECLSLSEILTAAMRRNVTDKFLKQSIPDGAPDDSGSNFLCRAAPNLAAVFAP